MTPFRLIIDVLLIADDRIRCLIFPSYYVLPRYKVYRNIYGDDDIGYIYFVGSTKWEIWWMISMSFWRMRMTVVLQEIKVFRARKNARVIWKSIDSNIKSNYMPLKCDIDCVYSNSVNKNAIWIREFRCILKWNEILLIKHCKNKARFVDFHY